MQTFWVAYTGAASGEALGDRTTARLRNPDALLQRIRQLSLVGSPSRFRSDEPGMKCAALAVRGITACANGSFHCASSPDLQHGFDPRQSHALRAWADSRFRLKAVGAGHRREASLIALAVSELLIKGWHSSSRWKRPGW